MPIEKCLTTSPSLRTPTTPSSSAKRTPQIVQKVRNIIPLGIVVANVCRWSLLLFIYFTSGLTDFMVTTYYLRYMLVMLELYKIWMKLIINN